MSRYMAQGRVADLVRILGTSPKGHQPQSDQLHVDPDALSCERRTVDFGSAQ